MLKDAYGDGWCVVSLVAVWGLPRIEELNTAVVMIEAFKKSGDRVSRVDMEK